MVTITGSSYQNPVVGTNGADSISLKDAAYTIYGYDGDDGDDGDDVLGGRVIDGGDSIEGRDGDDTIYGYGGSDSLDGGKDNDYLDGGTGNDYLKGRDGDDTIYGGEGTDYLAGGDGNDTVFGGDGNDYLNGGDGSDYLAGGDGNDMFYFDHNFVYGNYLGEDIGLDPDSDVILDFEVGKDKIQFNNLVESYDELNIVNNSNGDAVIYLPYYTLTWIGVDAADLDISNFQIKGGGIYEVYEIYGTDGNDLMSGADTSVPERLSGLDGNDSLYGYIGTDSLFGGDGDDYLDGGSGIGFLYGESGDDLIYGGDTWDIMKGGSGNDTMYGGAGDDQIQSDAGNDYLYGGQGNDLFQYSSQDINESSNDFIEDFNLDDDKIQLHFIVDEFSDVDIANNASGNAVITLSATSTIELLGVNSTDLTADHFDIAS